jgi:phosphoglycerate kinase
MKTIRDINISGKRIFLRVDFNVPLDEKMNVTDDTRIRGVLPTLQYALEQNAKVILASHLGRPKGKPVAEFSLKPAARALEKILGKPVVMAEDCMGDGVSAMVSKMQPGDILMLENLRFHPEEEKDDDVFAKALAGLCDAYVNDAFAVSHRKNASVYAITQHAPVSVAGLLMEKEITYFNQAMKDPKRPLATVVGGAKVSTKLGALTNMINQVDKIIIGGAMANTFLKSQGLNMGKSKIEEDLVDTAKTVMEKAAAKNVKIYLPVDAVVADRLAPDASTRIVPVQEIPANEMALDIGPATSLLFKKALSDAKTIIWNGPMGAFETEIFARGTMEMVNTLTESGALTIVGGGDTDVAVHQSGKADKITYISTGGGAFLELLEGKSLPGISALEEADR